MAILRLDPGQKAPIIPLEMPGATTIHYAIFRALEALGYEPDEFEGEPRMFHCLPTGPVGPLAEDALASDYDGALVILVI